MKHIYYLIGGLSLCLMSALNVSAQTKVTYGGAISVDPTTFTTYYACLGEDTNNGEIRFRPSSTLSGNYVWKRNGINLSTGTNNIGSIEIFYNTSNNYRLRLRSSSNSVEQEYEGLYELVNTTTSATAAYFYLDVVPSPVISLPTSGNYCVGDALSVAVTASNGPPLTYTWEAGGSPTGSNSGTITTTDAGIHSITVSDDLGCSATDTGPDVGSPTASQPTLQASVGGSPLGGTLVCPGSDVVLTASTSLPNPTFRWEVNGSTSISTAATFNINNVTSAQNISVEVRNGSNCWSTPRTLNLALFSATNPSVSVKNGEGLDQVNSLGPPVDLSNLGTLLNISNDSDCKTNARLSGPGVSGTTFYPGSAVTTSNAITLNYECPNSDCGVSDDFTVNVYTLAFDKSSYCVGDDIVMTVQGLNFTPSAISLGSTTISVFNNMLTTSGGFSSGTISFTIPTTISGTQTLVLQGGVEKIEETVTINARPATPTLQVLRNATNTLNSGAVICPGDNLGLSTPASASRYYWTVNGQSNSTTAGNFAVIDAQSNLSIGLHLENANGCTSDTVTFDVTVSSDITAPTLAPDLAVFDTITVNSPPISLDTNVSVTAGSCHSSASFSGVGVSNNFFYADVAANSGSIIPITYSCLNNAGCPLSASFDVSIGGAAIKPKANSYCLGTTVVLDVIDLTIQVDSVTVPLRGGGTVKLPLDITNLVLVSSKYSGDLSFSLPNQAISGTYIFHEILPGTGIESAAIAVRNPELSLNLAPEYCSNSSSVALSGSPTTGNSVYSLVPDSIPIPSSVLSTNILNPANVDTFLEGSSATRFRTLNIVRAYTPSGCTSGAPFYPIRDTFQTVVRDIELNGFDIGFGTYANSSGPLNLTSFVSPAWGTDLIGTFSGLGVVDTSFFASLVDTGQTYTLTFTRQNGGCSAQDTDSLRVVEGSALGLRSIYCTQAEGDTLRRDPNTFEGSFTYSFNRSSTGTRAPEVTVNTPPSFSGMTQITQYQPNLFFPCDTAQGLMTEEWTYGAFRVEGLGIVTLDTTLGDEEFLFRPDLVNFSGSDTTITIEFSYFNWDRLPFDQTLTDSSVSGCEVYYPAGTEVYRFRVSYQPFNVRIFRPTFQANTPAALCGVRSDTIQLQASPNNGVFRLQDRTTGGIIDTLLYGSASGVVPRDFQVIGQDTTYHLVYDFSDVPGFNACPVDTIMRSLRIVGDYNLNFTGRHSNHSDSTKRNVYCLNESNDLLTISLGRDTSGGGIITGPGVIQSGGSFFFSPSQANVGTHTLTLSYTDTEGCLSTEQKQFKVVAPPSVVFTGDKELCVNDGLNSLTAEVNSSPYTPNGSQDTAFFVLRSDTLLYGATYLPANLAVGIANVQVIYVDSAQVATGCRTVLNDTIQISPTPNLSISGLAPAYCASDPDVTLTGSPSSGGTGSFFGSRIVSANVFDPDAVTVSTGVVIDEVNYTFEDGTTNCRDTISQNVEIRQVPSLNLSGLNTEYCSSDDVDTSITPIVSDAAGSQVSISFTGLGARLIGNDLQFRPATLVDSSQTSTTLTLEYTSSSGCVVAINRNVSLFSTPTVSMANTLDTTYCSNAQPVTFQVTGQSRTGNTSAAGASLSGGGIPTASQNPTFSQLDSAFNITYDVTYQPTLVSPGLDTVTFFFTDEEGCKNSVSKLILIDTLPTISLTGLNSYYCAGSGIDTLQGTPAGGVFSSFNTSVEASLNSTSGLFNPGSLAVGTESLYYTAAGTNGCRDTLSQTFEIKALPVVNLTGLNNSYCANEDSIALTATPAGGWFSSSSSVTAVDSATGIFRPVTAGATASYPISYTFVDNFGCLNRDTDNTEVLPTPNPVNSLSIINFCSNAGIQTLTGSPGTSNLNSAIFYLASGGPGINLNAGTYIFDPSSANAGVDTIIYQVENNSGCTEFDRKPVFVVTAPDVTFTGLAPFYCKDASNAVLTPNITGGSFSSTPAGAIVNGNEFSAAVASPNNYDVVYAYQESTTSLVDSTTVTCIDEHTESTEVRALPTPSFTGLAPNYCQSDTTSILLTPAAGFTGGTFSNVNGGISGNFFRPNDAQAGPDTITYTYTDATTTCTGIANETTQIRRQPNSVNISNLNSRYCADATTTFDVQGDLINIASSTSAPAAGSSVSVTGYGVVGTAIFDGGSGIFQNYNVNYDLNLAASQNIPQDTIVLIFANEFGCSDTIQQLVTVDTIPDVRFQNLDSIYCRNAGILTLTNTGIPSIFTGSGGEFRSQNNAASIQNNVEYVLGTTTLGLDTLIYDYEDDNGCQDTAQWSFNIVDPPVVSFDFIDTMGNVVDTVCLSSGRIRLIPNLLGGTFSGSGVVDDTSFTTNIGSGTYIITYTYTDASTGCSNIFQDSIVVAPLPEVNFTGLGASAYCQDSLLITLADSSSIAGGYGPAAFNHTFFEQTLPTGVTQRISGDTLLLNPISMIIGQHTIRRIVEDSVSGCSARVSETVVIHPLPDNLEVLNVDSTHCRNDVITAEGRPVQGANSTGRLVLLWNAAVGPVAVDTTFGNISSLEPAVDTLPNGQFLPTGSYTYEYIFNDVNGCQNRVLDTFAIHPNPVASFMADPVCERDSIALFSTSTISDAISVFDSIAVLDWRYMNNITASDSLVWIETSSQDVGSHDVRLEVTTGIGCAASVSAPDGLKIYAKPDVSFVASNHCQGDSSRFVSDSLWIDYLNGLDPNYSSIFELRWDFGDGDSSVLNAPINNFNASHLYANAGAYQVSLNIEVGDGTFGCISSDSFSFIVSPSIAQYPYYQTFDTQGDWFAESSDANLPNYWNWGLAQGAVIQTTAADSFNTVWKTQPTNQAPTDAWLYGACFDLASLERPMIAFDYWSQTEEGLDGTVLEYFNTNTNKWLPLGNIERGINWFNTNIIAGAPGDQTLAPRGWSGRSLGWNNARYRLDDYQNLSRMRLRFAFGASGSVSAPSDGFALDNIWVGERQRNVLLETFSNKSFLNMSNINNRLYDLLYSPDLVRDVTLLQYHGKSPNSSDEFHQDNPGDVSSRELFYKVDNAAEGFKDGNSVGNLLINITNTSNAQFEAYFDANMLEDPDFKLGFNRAEVTGGTVFVNLSIEALRDLGQDDYVIHIAVLEDSLTYPGGNARVNAVMRKLLPEAGGQLRSRSWAAGDRDSLSAQWTIPNSGYNSNNFTVLAFIQSNSTEEVFQSVSNRNISGFVVGSSEVTEEEREAAQEGLFTAKVFPNPAKEGFHVAFDRPLQETCHWEIFDLQGRLLQSGEVAAPTEQFYLSRAGWTAGMYVLRLRVGNAYTQRPVIFAAP